jgi:hypothetical protein
MPPKLTISEELIIALKDARVLEALGAIFESKLQPLLESVNELQQENIRKGSQITKLQQELHSATARIEALEMYARRDNLLIAGLPSGSYAEATTSTQPGADSQPSESVEQAVINLCTQQLGVKITPSDISIAHRIPSKRNGNITGPPMTIVKFSNRKAREAVYAARRKLRDAPTRGIFINEDLNKATADLFRQARQLVRDRNIHSTWTSSCSVYIKETSESRPKKVVTRADFPSALG